MSNNLEFIADDRILSEASRSVCLENIKTFAKIKNVQIGQLEKDVGVSPGYLSRKKEGGRIPLSVVEKISKKLDVALISLFTAMTESDVFHHYIKAKTYNAIGIEKTESGFCCYVTVGGRRYRTTPFKTMEEAGAYMSQCIGKRRKSK